VGAGSRCCPGCCSLLATVLLRCTRNPAHRPSCWSGWCKLQYVRLGSHVLILVPPSGCRRLPSSGSAVNLVEVERLFATYSEPDPEAEGGEPIIADEGLTRLCSDLGVDMFTDVCGRGRGFGGSPLPARSSRHRPPDVAPSPWGLCDAGGGACAGVQDGRQGARRVHEGPVDSWPDGHRVG
jgi:hypothetical protein